MDDFKIYKELDRIKGEIYEISARTQSTNATANRIFEELVRERPKKKKDWLIQSLNESRFADCRDFFLVSAGAYLFVNTIITLFEWWF